MEEGGERRVHATFLPLIDLSAGWCLDNQLKRGKICAPPCPTVSPEPSLSSGHVQRYPRLCHTPVPSAPHHTSRHWVWGASGKNIIVCLYLGMKSNQSYLLPEVTLSRPVWILCPGDSVQQTSEKKTKEREGKRLPAGNWGFWGGLGPREVWLARKLKHIQPPQKM